MFISKDQQRLTSLLGLLAILAGSTSTSIRHCHSNGLLPHAHGFGFASSIRPAVEDQESTLFATGGPASRHCHFILFGVEFYEGEESSGTPNSRLPGSQDAPQVSPGMGGGCPRG